LSNALPAARGREKVACVASNMRGWQHGENEVRGDVNWVCLWMLKKKIARGRCPRTPCLLCDSLRSPGAPRPPYRHLAIHIATRR
jgi:hypothetical protein